MAVEIVRIPALSDNYIWLMRDCDSGETVVIDPAAAEPVLAEAESRGWKITQIWNTHWHRDHTGGNAAIKEATGATITGPAAEAEKIATLDRMVSDGDTVKIGAIEARVLGVGAHTAGHIAYHLPGEDVAFVGDTLFAMGCGRLFEGTAEDMFAAMRKLDALPASTRIYCAHEYTLSNGRFAVVAEPGNDAMKHRLAAVEKMRAEGQPTVPTTLAAERETNPFLRAPDAATLAERRAAKDSFAG
jgi:hydroxyacylglutathione hydrolase